MEINAARRARRNEPVTRQTEGRKDAGGRTKARPTYQEDRLALSQQALRMLEEQNRKAREERERRRLEQEKNAGKSELDAVTKALKAMQRCQKIAARIIAGDKVPPEDEKYLMDNDPQGYQLAMSMRKLKKDPKEWESVLENEEERMSSESRESSGESADSAESGGETAEV